MPVTRYHCEYAWPSGRAGLLADVLVTMEDGRFRAVTAGAARPPDAVGLPGVTLPGLANTHSHAFHRALRGRTHIGPGSFWTWREQMYRLAATLDPDSYHALALAVYQEMALAGITVVGEFHYLHHGPGGHRYDDPNAMAAALIAAARTAGLRITLLDTVYLTSTVDGGPLEGVQRRFGDGSLDDWRERHARLRESDGVRIGAALHSVRAVPRESLQPVGHPLHIHLSEQRSENAACRSVYGVSPTELLRAGGLLGPDLTAIHATHLSSVDRALLGNAGTRICLCPTTERDLADGLGSNRALADAGTPLCLGSDSHAVIDLFEEARTVELDERQRTEQRGNFTGAELLDAATVSGHQALGWPDAGRIEPGQRADLVTVRLDSVRTRGIDPAGLFYAASAADVTHVVVDGHPIVRDGHHLGATGSARP